MNHNAKVAYMYNWCQKNGLTLQLEGECGLGRECVGVSINYTYPDYIWYNEDWDFAEEYMEDMYVPEDAYHKHPCVAVLGRGEKAEAQLYEWILWFENNGFELEIALVDIPHDDIILKMLGRDKQYRMVKRA